MSYKKECMFCKQEIKMNEKLGKWYPSDINGGTHYCEAKKDKQQPVAKPQEPKLKTALELTLLIEQMNDRLRRVERIVVDPRT